MNITKKSSLLFLLIGLCLSITNIQAKDKVSGLVQFLFPIPTALYNAGCDESGNRPFYQYHYFFDIFYPGEIETTFDDVAGLDDAKENMQEIVNFFKDPLDFHMMGAHIPKGILMNGLPGTGKTLLARALAGEINRPFISVSGSSFNGQYVGEGTARVKELFEKARSIAPCIIFIDEIDAVASKRSNESGGASKDRNETLTALLTEMDGLHQYYKSIIVIGATNRIDQLDPAIIRPGRFDRIIEIKKPNQQDRENLLRLFFNKTTHAHDLDIAKIAAMTSGFSGADLSNLVNQSILIAKKEDLFCIHMHHVQKAFDAIKQGIITVMNASKSIDILYPGDMNTTLQDVAGLDGAKEDLKDVIAFLKNPKSFDEIGAKIPKGILMQGPPGTGKTLLARALAGEVNCPFISIKGSDFSSQWAGIGKEKVTELFKIAREIAPCILFIDEIDAVAAKRSNNSGGVARDDNKTITALLTEMDGLQQYDKPIIVIGATNRIDQLDPAIIRPGRFDRIVEVTKPFIKDRIQLLQIACAKSKLAKDVNIEHIARITTGFSGAELTNLINEAAILAVKDNYSMIYMQHIEDAYDNITLGRETKGMLQNKEDLWHTAIHEAGHLIGYLFLDKTMAVHKVSIVPRGKALGVAHMLPLHESYESTQNSMKNHIIVCLAGRFAEEAFDFGLSSGAANDLEEAKRIAYNMVVTYGMSENLRDISYAQFDDELPNDVATKIDQEINKIIAECRIKTRNLIADHKKEIEKIAKLLMQKGTVQGSEIYRLLNLPQPQFATI